MKWVHCTGTRNLCNGKDELFFKDGYCTESIVRYVATSKGTHGSLTDDVHGRTDEGGA